MTTDPTTEEPRLLREMRAKHGDAFVDSAIAIADAAPPLSESQLARMRQIFAAARSGKSPAA